MQMYSSNQAVHSLENSANKCSRTAANLAILLPRILCQNLQTVHTGRTSISVLKFNDVRTAFNQAVLFLENCAALMKPVPTGRTTISGN